MDPAAPKIGFDRFIDLEWAATALRVRSGRRAPQDLIDLLEETHPGLAARKKTRTVLNRLWLEPRPELADFAARGVDIYIRAPDTPITALCWGVAIASYPFFGKVAELVGRLTALHGDCTSAEIHRRMAELYGEREGTLRMTNMVLQTQVSWRAIERSEDGRRFTRTSTTKIHNGDAVAWLIEAAVRYSGRVLSLAEIEAAPVIFPLQLEGSLGMAVTASPSLELRNEGGGRQVAAMRA
jgi:hypothetical protein